MKKKNQLTVVTFWLFLLMFSTNQFRVVALSLKAKTTAKKDKPQVRQANIPSSIVIAMDIPAFGLKGEEKWIDVIGANEKAISHEEYMKEANSRKRLSELEGKSKVVNALFSFMSNSQSEESLRESTRDNKNQIEREENEQNSSLERDRDGKNGKNARESMKGMDHVPKPFYNGPVHPNDLLPVYENWVLENDKHGEKGKDVLPFLKISRKKAE